MRTIELEAAMKEHGVETLEALQEFVALRTGHKVGTATLSRCMNGGDGISSRNLVALQQAFPEVSPESWAELVQLKKTTND